MSDGYNFVNIEAAFKKYISSGNKILGKNTVKNYISDLRHFLGWYHTSTKSADMSQDPATNPSYFENIDTNSVKRYIDYLQSTNNSPQTIKRRVSSLSTFLKYCLSNGLIVDNYVKRLRAEQKIAQISSSKAAEDTLLDESAPHMPQIVANLTPPIPQSPLYPAHKLRSFTFILLIVLTFALLYANSRYLSRAGSQPDSIPLLSKVSKDSTRVLTFRGRLTDSLGNPIAKKTDVRFKLYKSETTNNVAFESNACTVYPDVEGNFEVLIGSSEKNINTIGCDKKIPSVLFSATTPLFLGVTVGTNAEMKPRQQISNVALSDNALKLNGMAVGGNADSIPYINKNGEISLSGETAGINASAVSETFKITSSRSMLIQTGDEGSLTMSASQSGRIRFLTGGSDVDRMTIAENGNIGVGTINPAYFKLEISGSIGPSITKTYNLGAANRLWNTLYVNRICFDEQEKQCATSLSSSSGVAASPAATPSATIAAANNGDVLAGSTATTSANVKLSGSAGNASFIRTGYLGINTTTPQAALDVMGSANFGGNTVDITTSSNEDLTLVANGTGIISLKDNTSVGGNLSSGLDVASGTTIVDIGGTGTANALCHNSQSGTDNQQIVDCTSTPTADFAEIYPVSEGADYGQVMSLSSEEVRTNDGQYIRKLVPARRPNDQHLIGVISNNYGDFVSVGHNVRAEDNPMPIALKGRVPVKIASSSESIKAGDYLTSSLEPGKASKSNRPGVIIGKALEDWTATGGKNQIMVFVGTSYADPDSNSISLVENIKYFARMLQSPIIFDQKIISPIVEADSIIGTTLSINTIKPKDKNITIDLNKTASDEGELGKLAIVGENDQEVASVNGLGNASFSGSLAAREASISGTLTADTIDAKNIKDLEKRLASAVEKSTYNEDINSIQSVLGEIKNTKLPRADLYPAPPQGLVASESMSSLLDSLTVMGDTNLFNLQVHEKIYSLKDELKISALASINFMDGAIVMTKTGNITVRGTVTAKEVKAKKLSLQNDLEQETASIDASGAARFVSLSLAAKTNTSTPSAIIAAQRNFEDNGVFMPALESRSDSAGVGIVPTDESEVAIYNEALTDESLIFLTPTRESTASSSLSVAKKVTCQGGNTGLCRPYFSISAGTNGHPDIYFNWLILNGR